MKKAARCAAILFLSGAFSGCVSASEAPESKRVTVDCDRVRYEHAMALLYLEMATSQGDRSEAERWRLVLERTREQMEQCR